MDENSSTQRVLKENECGLTVTPDNQRAFKEALVEFRNMDRGFLRQMGEKSREYALLELTRKVNLDKVVSIIKGYFEL